jgi:hypothetical protein
VDRHVDVLRYKLKGIDVVRRWEVGGGGTRERKTDCGSCDHDIDVVSRDV